ncbi:MAG: hypothetical protein PHT07_10030 [Paludibacter sp.]|nr:hypothetical protein [Paludibacter sp.]
MAQVEVRSYNLAIFDRGVDMSAKSTLIKLDGIESVLFVEHEKEHVKDSTSAGLVRRVVFQCTVDSNSSGTMALDTGLTFSLERGEIQLEKKNSIAVFYSPQTIMFEKNSFLVEAFSKLFADGVNTILAFHKESIIDGGQWFYVCDPDISSLSASFKQELSLFSARATVSPDDEHYNVPLNTNNGFIASTFEHFSAFEVADKIITEWFSKNNVSDRDRLAIAATDIEDAFDEQKQFVLRALFVDTPVDTNALKQIGTIFKNNNPAILIELFRDETPITALKSAIGIGKIVSAPLANLIIGKSMRSPLVDVSSHTLDEASSFLQDPSFAQYNLFSMGNPSIIKNAIDSGLQTSPFFFPYSSGDENLNLSTDDTLSLVCTHGLFGTFAGGMVRNDTVLKGGLVDISGAKHFIKVIESTSSIARKAVFSINVKDDQLADLAAYIQKNIEMSYAFFADPAQSGLYHVFTAHQNFRDWSSHFNSTEDPVTLSISSKEELYKKLIASFKSNHTTLKRLHSSCKSFSGFVFSEVGDKEISYYRKNLTEHTNGGHLKAIREYSEKKNLIEQIKPNTILGVISAANIPIDDKVFPDVIHVNSSTKYSLKDIYKNPILSNRFLQIPGFSETVQHLLRQNNMKVPTVAPFVLDLVNFDNNKLPEHAKDLVISHEENLGILNYKYLPSIIDISTLDKKNAFIRFAAMTIASQYDESEEVDLVSIHDEVNKNLRQAVNDGEYVLLKTETTFLQKEGTFKNVEVFTVANRQLKDIATLGISPLHFLKTAKDYGVFAVADRAKSVTMKTRVATRIFQGIQDFIKTAYDKYEQEYINSDVKSLLIKAAEISHGNSIFTQEMKSKIYHGFLRKTDFPKIVENVIGNHKDPKKIIDAVLREAVSDGLVVGSYADDKIKAESFMEKFFYPSPRAFFSGKNANTCKEAFDRFFANTDYKHLLWSRMSEYAKYDNDIEKAVMKVFDSFAILFDMEMIESSNYSEQKKAIERNRIINIFLSDLLGLNPHQILEVKGYLAMNLSGQKNTELPFWEMRTGKTRTMLSINALLSMVHKQSSIFFIQGKNYDDIVAQFWDTNPLILSEAGVFIGEQNLFEKNNYAFPFPISDDLFPNIPAILKKELVSPDEDPTHPAERLGRDFLSFYWQIKERIGDDRDEVLKKIQSLLSKNQDMKVLLDHPAFHSDQKAFKDASATIYYLSYLIENKFLIQNEHTVSVVKKKIFENFFGRMLEEKKRYLSQAEGNVIFAGKQFVENFSASDSAPAKLFKSSKMTLTSTVDIKKANRSTKEFYATSYDAKGEPDGGRLWDFYSKEMYSNISSPSSFQGSKSTYGQFPFIIDGSKNALSTMDDIMKIASERIDEYLKTVDTTPYEDIFAGSEIAPADITEFMSRQVQPILRFVSAKIKGENNGIVDTKRPYDPIAVNGEILEGSAIDLNKINFEEAMIPALQMIGVANPKNAVARIKSEIFKSHRIALEISTASFVWSVKEMFMAHKNRHFDKRVSAVFGKKMGADSVSFTIDLSGKTDRLLFPSKVSTLPDGSKVNKVDYFEFMTDTNTEKKPHVFTEKDVLPRTINYTLKSAETHAEITNAVVSGEMPVSKSSGRFTRSNNASYFWSINADNEIASISIDEAHKNTSNQKAFQLKSLLDSVERLYPRGSKLIATGTPLAGLKSFTKLIETISGADGVGFSSTILKYCGNFKFKRVFGAALYTAFKNDTEFFAQFSQIMVDIFGGKEFDSSRIGLISSYPGASHVVNFVWGSNAIKAVFMEGGELSGVMVTKRDSERALYEIMEETVREYLRAAKEEDSDKLEIMMSSVWDAATKKNSFITIQAPGFNNPLGLSTFLGFLNKANVSIRRPSKDIFYEVIDKDHLSTYNHPDGALLTDDDRVLTRGVLGAEFILKKYQSYYQIHKIKETITLLFGMVADAIRTEPTKYGFSSFAEAGKILNRTQISVDDSVEDLYTRFLNNNGSVGADFAPDKEKAMFDIVHFVEGIILDKDFFIDRFNAIRYTEDERFDFDCRGIKMSLPKTFASQIDFHHISHGSAEVYFGEQPSRVAGNAVRVNLIKGVPNFEINGTLSPIHFSFPLTVSIDERFPSLRINYNAANRDDNTILETIAFINDTKELAQNHIENHENIRMMTTRVAITGAAILANVAAAVDRKDTDSAFNIVVNVTDGRLLDLINEIHKKAGSLMESNKVKIFASTPMNINSILTEFKARKEQISVVGNYESLAEGFDMEFVDTGMYLGAVRKTAAAIQSFARQIGFNKKVSSFYLANNGKLATLNGQIESKTAEKSLLKAAVSLAESEISNHSGNSVFNYAISLSKNGVTVAPSDIISANLASYQELLSYEHFMNGALVSNEQIEEKTLMTWSKAEVKNKISAPTTKVVIRASSKETLSGTLISKRF